MSTLDLLEDAVAEMGWNDDSKLLVLCEFIDRLVPAAFAEYLKQRVEAEQALSFESDSPSKNDDVVNFETLLEG